MTGSPSPTSRRPRGPAASLVQRLIPFRNQGVLDAIDLHVVSELGALLGEEDPDVLLALALAVRAPRHGHVCVDLQTLSVEQLVTEPRDEAGLEPGALRFPDDRAAWIARVSGSPLVAGRASGDAQIASARPFVLDANLLYTDRNFAYQTRLARQLGAGRRSA